MNEIKSVTKLVNVKYNKCDVYIGRKMPATAFKSNKLHSGYYGNPKGLGLDGYFGNPFRLVDYVGDRIACIKDYEKYFYLTLESDKEFLKNVQELKGKILGCWCWPDLCHGEIIIDYLEKK